MNGLLVGIASGVGAAIATDIDAFIAVRKDNKRAKFDWTITFARAVKGALWGAGIGGPVGVAIGG